jgi:hypothetical protein
VFTVTPAPPDTVTAPVPSWIIAILVARGNTTTEVSGIVMVLSEDELTLSTFVLPSSTSLNPKVLLIVVDTTLAPVFKPTFLKF